MIDFVSLQDKRNAMKRHILGLAAAVLIATSMTFSGCANGDTANDLPLETLTEVQTAFPKAAALQLSDDGSYMVKNKSGRFLGTVMLSSPYSDEVKGFNGPVPLQISFDKKGRVIEVRVLDNEETPSFLNRVVKAGFLNTWDGLTAEEAINKEVDAVSGATYSSRAIRNGLKVRLEAALKAE